MYMYQYSNFYLFYSLQTVESHNFIFYIYKVYKVCVLFSGVPVSQGVGLPNVLSSLLPGTSAPTSGIPGVGVDVGSLFQKLVAAGIIPKGAKPENKPKEAVKEETKPREERREEPRADPPKRKVCALVN